MTEVVDDEIRVAGAQAEGGEPFCNSLVHTSLVIDPGMAAEEAGGERGNVSGKGTRLLENQGISAGRLASEAGVTVAHVIPAPVVVRKDVWSVEEGSNLAGAVVVEHFVGVEDEDPVATAMGEDTVASAGEIVFPGEVKEFGVELADDVGSGVGGTGVADEDAIDEGSDAGETAGKAGRGAVLHDHVEFDGGHRKARRPCGARVVKRLGRWCSIGRWSVDFQPPGDGEGTRTRKIRNGAFQNGSGDVSCSTFG